MAAVKLESAAPLRSGEQAAGGSRTDDIKAGTLMTHGKPFYFGNASADQVRNTGWFIGQFVPPELGLRHQTDVEVKWGMHPDGDKRPRPWANGNGTTISVLFRGTLHVRFHTVGTPEVVTLAKEGDYVIYGPDMVHSWEAAGDTLVLSVRFPSVEIGQQHAIRSNG